MRVGTPNVTGLRAMNAVNAMNGAEAPARPTRKTRPLTVRRWAGFTSAG
jgi:hypothetical protein